MHPTRSEHHTRRRRWLFRLAALGLSLLLCEAALQGASRLSPDIQRALLPSYRQVAISSDDVKCDLSDPVLWYRGNPAYEGHDRLGFPNPGVPDSADIVVLGDSQTYGPLGKPDLAWPAVLRDLLDVNVYNMGFFGWGPIEYISLLDEALAFEPSLVIVGFYFGNDLYNAFWSVYVRHQREELETPGADVVIGAAETAGRLEDAVTMATKVSASAVTRRTQTRRNTVGLASRSRALLSEHSKLYGTARLIKDRCASLLFPGLVARTHEERLWQQQIRWTQRHPDMGAIFEHGRFRTVLTPPYRNLVLDLSDPRIAEGLALSLRTMGFCDVQCRRAGARFAVVLIPSKEHVFQGLAGSGPVDPALERLVASEVEVRRHVVAFLQEKGIPYVDTLGSLRKCFENGIQPYPMTRDGHPNPAGYKAIAESVAALWNESHATAVTARIATSP